MGLGDDDASADDQAEDHTPADDTQGNHHAEGYYNGKADDNT